MFQGKKISVVFPAYNEEEGIKAAIDSFFKTKVVDEIVVVDNNSTDRTAAIIKKTKARYVLETKQGYGNALQRGLKEAKGDYIITVEPDGTFLASDIHKLLQYTDHFDAIFGTRTSKECIWTNANMGWFLRLGNWFVAKILEYVHNGPCLTDVGCTFKLIKRPAYNKIKSQLTVGGSHFSPEFMMVCIKNKIPTVEIPVIYKSRVGESKITGSFIKAFKLGLVMLWAIFAYKITGKR